MRRAVVIGTSGCGKTTFARRLAHSISAAHFELDALFWGRNWTPRPAGDFVESVRQAIARPTWVVDGNYDAVRPLVWGAADTIIWLDYSFPCVLARVVKRTLARAVKRKTLWSGNRETLRRTFSRESIVLWSIRTYRPRRREYEALLSQIDLDIQVLRLSRPSDAELLLATRPSAKTA